MKSIVFFVFLMLSGFVGFSQEIFSPNKKVRVTLQVNNSTRFDIQSSVYFSVAYFTSGKYVTVMPASALGLTTKYEKFISGLKLTSVLEPLAIHEKYQMITGKRRWCENFATERTFLFTNANGKQLNIIFRAYNNGVTFRYELPALKSADVNITGENTIYTLSDTTNRWMQPYNSAYEDFYIENKTGEGKKGQQWCFPALYKANDVDVWVLITEAEIKVDNCAARLSNSGHSNQYKVTYPESRDNFTQTGATALLPWLSQWHVLIIGSLADVVESTLVTDVCTPDQLKNTSWIHPGSAAWIYWANNHGSKDYRKVIEYIDLANEMKWPYVLIDWEWDAMSDGGTLLDAVKYAKQKGIKLLLWYNSGTSWLEPTPVDRLLTPEKRAKEFAWLSSIGVYGIKVDFFAGDQQDMMKYYIDILKDAARYHLLVNFHGATLPRGWARTYPNLMSTEPVYGAEWYNNGPALTEAAARHNTTLPFTRNIVGSMDYTPVTFSNSQYPHITSFGHELALSVVFESALQHFADHPSAYDSLPEIPKQFLKTVPTTWDDSKLIDGYPGEKIIIARRAGSDWYLGALNGKDEKQTFYFNLDFIKGKNLTMHLVSDGETGKSLNTATISLEQGKEVSVTCLPRGGFVGIIKGKKNYK